MRYLDILSSVDHNKHPHLLEIPLRAQPKVATRRYSVGSYSQARATIKKNTGSTYRNKAPRPRIKGKPASQNDTATILIVSRDSNEPLQATKSLFSL